MRAILRVVTFAIVALTASLAAAQTLLSGVLVDPEMQPVARATIYLTNVATSAQLDFETDARGQFEFSGLAPGQYRVTSDLQGFTPRVITLAAGTPVRET